MKIAVKVWFEFNRENVNNDSVELDDSPHFMEWNYPAIPTVGHYICQPAQFLSDREKEVFKEVKVKDFFKNSYMEGTLFDYYNDVNGDRFIVSDIEWVYDNEEGHYPIINIMER